MNAKLLQSCLTLCDLMDSSQPGSSVHGIFQAGILEWVPFPPPGDLPKLGIESSSPELAGRFFTTESPGNNWILKFKNNTIYNSPSMKYICINLTKYVQDLFVELNKNTTYQNCKMQEKVCRGKFEWTYSH